MKSKEMKKQLNDIKLIFECNLTPAAGPSTLLGMPNLSSSTNNNTKPKTTNEDHLI